MRIEKKDVLEKAVQSLGEQIKPDIVTVVNEGNDTRMDAIVRIKDFDFVCSIKGNITNANMNTTLRQLSEYKKNDDMPVLLISKYIYPGLMNELALHGINVLDSAGNCIIRHNNLLLNIKGQKNAFVKEDANRAFQDTGLKLVFHFLLHPENVNLPYRAIQEKNDISLDTIKKVIDDLTTNHFILKTEHGRFLKNRKKLLERWVTAYNQTLKPKLLLGRMTFRNSEKRDKWLAMDLRKGCIGVVNQAQT